jgi:hypothetical protein
VAGPAAVEADLAHVALPRQVWSMNSPPLSEWMPAMWNGNSSHNSSRPATMHSPFHRTAIASVQSGTTSVSMVIEC